MSIETRQGLTDTDVAELVEILEDVSERTATVAVTLLRGEKGIDVETKYGDDAVQTLLRFADVYPFETVEAVQATVLAQDLLASLGLL